MKKPCLTYIVLLTLVIVIMANIPVNAQGRPSVISEGAVLMDADTGQILYSKNANRTLAPASITKLMTALLTLEHLSPEDTITFSRNAVMSIESGSSHIGLREGETITVEDALHGLLLESANEVANGLAEAVGGTINDFAQMMNERTIELGGLNTNFLNPHGLYDEQHYTTAYDMALITKELLTHDYFLEVMSHYKWQIQPTNKVDEIRYLHQGHKLLNPENDKTLYRDDTIAGKTGYTVKSGHTLVTVSEIDGRRLIAVSLKTDANHLYSDTNTMLNYGFDNFKDADVQADAHALTLSLNTLDQIIGQAVVQPSDDLTLLIPIDANPEDIVALESITAQPGIDASVGDIVGTIDYTLDGQLLTSVDLIITQLSLESELTPDSELSSEGTDILEPDNQNNSSIAMTILKVFLWLLVAAAVIIGFLFLYRLDRKKRMSYRQYKAMRDAKKDRRHP